MEKTTATTGLRKRQQIGAANRMVFVWVIIASVVIGVAVVLAQFMMRQLLFNNKILGELNTTNSNITKSISSYDGLKTEVTKLFADNNLNVLKKGADSTALQVVIDALPTEKNQVALATSMQSEILGPAGVSIMSFSIVDTTGSAAATTSSATAVTTGAQSFDFSFTISGTYAQVQQALKNIERSIRPVTILTIDTKGTDAQMRTSVTARTYYQPAITVQLQQGTVKP